MNAASAALDREPFAVAPRTVQPTLAQMHQQLKAEYLEAAATSPRVTIQTAFDGRQELQVIVNEAFGWPGGEQHLVSMLEILRDLGEGKFESAASGRRLLIERMAEQHAERNASDMVIGDE